MNTRVPSWSLPLALAVGLATMPVGGSAQQTNPLVGTWSGALSVGHGATLRLVFHVTGAKNGSLSGTMDSPDQGATGIPLSDVTLSDPKVHFGVASVHGAFEGTLSQSHDSIVGTWGQGTVSLPLTLERGTGAPAPARPQEPKPPFPYRAEDVHVSVPGTNVVLAGTLTLPRGSGPFPAAVLVTGSGPQDRDETIMGHKPFLVLADYLTRHGVAVLRYDDRGVGRSTGDFAAATTRDFAKDALAAVEFLHRRAEIAHDRIGVIGHSEGGLIAPMVAAESSDVAYIVLLAGPGLPGEQIIQEQGELIGAAMGTPKDILALNRRVQARLAEVVAKEPDRAAAVPKLRAILEEARDSLPPEAREEATRTMDATIRQVNSPWFRFFLSYDPRPTLERVKVPVLAIGGSKDLQVPAKQNLAEIKQALRRGGDKDVTTVLLPGLNHLFQKAETGAPSEYAKIAETMDPSALSTVTDWILKRFGGHARSES